MTYEKFVWYTVVVCCLVLPRNQLYKDVLKGAEVAEVMHSNPDCREFMHSLYECRYAEFFQKLAVVESIISSDRYLAAHNRYYVRQMRILAYSQLLDSYR